MSRQEILQYLLEDWVKKFKPKSIDSLNAVIECPVCKICWQSKEKEWHMGNCLWKKTKKTLEETE